MKRSNVRCPVCGQLNEGLDLEETEGWAECCSARSSLWRPPMRGSHLIRNCPS